MPVLPPAGPTPHALRLWPGALAAALLLLVWFVFPLVGLVDGGLAVIAGFAGAAAVLLWWLGFSRTSWTDRALAIAAMVAAMAVVRPLVHESIADGMMGNMLVILAVPLMSMALVAAVAVGRHRTVAWRRTAIATAIAAVAGSLLLVRTEGITGSAQSDLHWRWTPTPEERLLAASAAEPSLSVALSIPPSDPALGAGADDRLQRPSMVEPDAAKPDDRVSAAVPALESASHTPVVTAANDRAATAVVAAESDVVAAWPGFRGAQRDDVIRGVRIATDWAATPPVELWRRPVGPAWSSFAVAGGRVFTQEQRGDDEIVGSYDLHTGAPIWMHRDRTRFWESNGGAGPRATPTLSRGRVYAFGATGILNALNARDGAVIWSRNAAADTGQPIPGWGFASSPLVVADLVLVHAGALVAYDASTGERRWTASLASGGYSSPQLVTLAGVPQILMMNGRGASSVALPGGGVLWEHAWSGTPIVQPVALDDGDVLVSTADAMGGSGTRRLAVAPSAAGWAVTERWTSKGLKPYFNDFVVHDGHAFGFDGNILACIDLEDGARRWKGGRYGHGQLVLLPEQGLLLVLSEDGELALVEATTERFRELARFPALDGKTWNHPVIAGDVLLVRNAEEMAAFRLVLAGR